MQTIRVFLGNIGSLKLSQLFLNKLVVSCKILQRHFKKVGDAIMCGIVGILAERPVAPLLLDGLKRLEYRGYDSAGIATIAGGKIEYRRAEGKIDKLAAKLQQE